MDNNKIDEGLQGNEKIETRNRRHWQQEASEEMLSAYPDSDTQTHERGRSVYHSGGTADGWRSDADTGSADAGRQ